MSRASAQDAFQRAASSYGAGIERRREKVDGVDAAFSSKDLQNKSRAVFLKTLGLNEQAREKLERAQSVITGTIGATAPVAFPAAKTLGAAALKTSAGKAASKAVGAATDQVGEAVSSAGRSVVSSAGDAVSEAGSAITSRLAGGATQAANAAGNETELVATDVYTLGDPFPVQTSSTADEAVPEATSSTSDVLGDGASAAEQGAKSAGASAAENVGKDFAEAALPEAEEAGISILGDVLGPIGILASIGVTLGLEISNATKKSKQENPDTPSAPAQVNFNPSQYGRVQKAVAPSLNAAAAVQNAPTNF